MLMQSRHEVEIQRMERVLRSYGVLTRERLCEMCNGEHMPVNVRIALEEGIAAGRIVALGDELVELPH
jgi:protein-arginine kinase